MANKRLFDTRGASIPTADTKNVAGGRAYSRSNEAALVQYALTGTFQNSFYVSAKFQLDKVLKLLEGADDRFVAQLAIYSRTKGYMKDMPSFLVAWLGAQKSPYFSVAFREVIDNGKMLRNFVQYIRSGVLGRKSFGTRLKREIQDWFERRDTYGLMRAVPGNDPSLEDIVKMVHPKAGDHKAFYAWLLGNEVNERKSGYFVKTRDGWRKLPQLVSDFERFKRHLDTGAEAPDVPFQLLTGLELPDKVWKTIARNAKWQMTRMNLNTFLRHGVFKDKALTKLIAERLADADQVRKARQFPYQLLAAYRNADGDVPASVREALQDAMEVAVGNVPVFERGVNIVVDVSGSMSSPVTGWDYGRRHSAVRCVDVAGLFAAAVLRQNREAEIVPVDQRVHQGKFNPRDSVISLADKIASYGGGATALGVGIEHLARKQAKGDIVVISDNESWADRYGSWNRGTGIEGAFQKYRRHDRKARLVLIDIWASDNTQAKTRENVLNVGGFSDNVFTVIDSFFRGELGGDHMVNEVKRAVTLNE